ncbi:hypothetical protein TUMEXPCC7403_00510 [Tumidithrix helvetica PCC 7403]|uniref:alpha-amylase family glycosyl hydrolase n=1 Tax=Tumidithrix helvetica TaxID=3457545 RepID=UPI003C8D96D3
MNLYSENRATSDIMLQTFYWDVTVRGERGKWYTHLQSQLADFANAGITVLWLPPPSKSRYQHYMGYTPMDYYDLGEYKQWIQEWPMTGADYWEESKGAETRFGTKAELVRLNDEAHKVGLKVIADLVLNHREAQQRNIAGEKICWKSDLHEIASKKMAWGYNQSDPIEIVTDSGGSGRDDGESGFAPNLAHTEPKVRLEIKEWLTWLKNDIHFDGWRYDMVKGYAPEHVAEYNYHTKPYLTVGEYWDGTQKIYDWIDRSDSFDVNKKSMAFDFPLQSHLRNIFWGDKPFEQLGLWKYSDVSVTGGWPAKSVTFLDNHDTIRQAYGDFPRDAKRLIQGYVFLLTHPGIPCIYWEHMYSIGSKVFDNISNLGKLRGQQNITNLSQVQVLQADRNCYAAKIDHRTIVKIGDSFWNPSGQSGSWDLKISGDGWAIWAS